MAKDSRTPQQVSEDLHAQLEHLTAALRHLAGHAPLPYIGAILGEAGRGWGAHCCGRCVVARGGTRQRSTLVSLARRTCPPNTTQWRCRTVEVGDIFPVHFSRGAGRPVRGCGRPSGNPLFAARAAVPPSAEVNRPVGYNSMGQ